MPEIPFPSPRLAGEGWVLREFRASDYAAVEESHEHPDTARWMNAMWEPDGAAMQSAFEAARLAGRWLYLIAASPDSDEYLGEIILFQRTAEMAEDGVAEIAYIVKPTARGRGIATGAVGALSAWALKHLDVARLQLAIHPENSASLRVAEKAGYTREGISRSLKVIRGDRIDVVRYSLIANELV